MVNQSQEPCRDQSQEPVAHPYLTLRVDHAPPRHAVRRVGRCEGIIIIIIINFIIHGLLSLLSLSPSTSRLRRIYSRDEGLNVTRVTQRDIIHIRAPYMALRSKAQASWDAVGEKHKWDNFLKSANHEIVPLEPFSPTARNRGL